MMIKALKITSIATLVCFSLSYVCWAASGVTSKDGLVKGLRTTYSKENPAVEIVKNSMPVVGIKKIESRGISMNVRVEPSTDGLLTYSLVADKNFYKPEDLKVETANGTIKISLNQENKKEKFSVNANVDEEDDGEFNINITESGGANLKLKIPQSIVEMSMETVSGDLRMENMILAALGVTGTSGDVKITGSKINDLNISSTSGDLKMDGDVKQLNFKVTSGDVELKIENPSPIINYKSVSGDIEVKFKKGTDVQMNYLSVSGDYEVKANEGKDALQGSKSVSTKIGAGTGSINVSTVSGDFKIKQ